MEPIPAGKIGRAAVGGVVPCKVLTPDWAGSTRYPYLTADICDGDATRLEVQASGGADILWHASTAGTQDDEWALVRLGPRPAHIIEFELTGSLEPGIAPYATAVRRYYDGTTMQDGEAIIVFDRGGQAGAYRGRARGAFDNENLRGSRGLAVRATDREGWDDKDVYYILWLEPNATLLVGEAIEAYGAYYDNPSNNQVWLSGVQVLGPGIICDQDPDENIWAKNETLGLWHANVAAGKKVIAAWNEFSNRWDVVATESTLVDRSVVTAVDFTGGTITKRNLKLPPWLIGDAYSAAADYDP